MFAVNKRGNDSTRLPHPRISRSATLKLLILISLVVAFSQITLGGIVRASESGLGCPDWPLCHGELIPPFEFHTLVEYSHRLTGTVLGILVIITLWVAALERKRDSVSFRPVSYTHLTLPTTPYV